MKVLLIATVQSHICQFHKPLVAMLHAHGCEVHVAARNNLAEKNGLKLDFVEQVFDVPFQRSPFSSKNLGAYRQLKAIINDGGYDVIHCNTPVGGVLGRLAARKARRRGTKVFYTAHGFHFYKGAPKKNWLIWYPVERFMCRYTDTLITIVSEDYALAAKKFPTRVERIHGIGANTAKYQKMSPQACAAVRQELGYAEGDALLLCTGELLPNKNQITVIRTLKRLADKYPHLYLMLAGNGPTLPQLKEEAAALGLSERVRFLGYCTDLERYANIADIIVSCSFREGLGMNIIEGMLLGKPAVTSYNRGHRELIEPGKNGFMAAPTDTAALAGYIETLLGDPATYAAMSAAALEMVQPYTDTHVQKELEAIYFPEA